MSICISPMMESVTAGALPVVDESAAQQGSTLIKRIPSESTVNRIAKHLHVPASGTTWERSQSAANIDAATRSDNEEEKPRVNNVNVEQQQGSTREPASVTGVTVSGQTKNYWDLPSAIFHEDDTQREKLLSKNNPQFGPAKKRRGVAPFRTSLETISQHDELQLCGNSDANSYESVLTVDELTGVAGLASGVYQQALNSCGYSQLPTASNNAEALELMAASKLVQQVAASAHASAHRTASCDVMLTVSNREMSHELAKSVLAKGYASGPRGSVQRTRSGSNQAQGPAEPVQNAQTGSSNLLETDSVSSNQLGSASGTSSNSNLLGSAASSTHVISAPASNLLGTRLFGGANLNLAAVGDRDEQLTDNEPSSNVSASSSVVFGTPLTSNSRVEVVVITTPNGSDSDLNQ